MNKRNFILGGCSALAAGVVLQSPATAGQSKTLITTRRLEFLPDLQVSPSLGTWHKYVGESFVYPLSYGAEDIELRRVDSHQSEGNEEQFTLMFAAAPNATPPAGTHVMRHEATGQKISLFLQAAGLDSEGATLYRADFNRVG